MPVSCMADVIWKMHLELKRVLMTAMQCAEPAAAEATAAEAGEEEEPAAKQMAPQPYLPPDIVSGR